MDSRRKLERVGDQGQGNLLVRVLMEPVLGPHWHRWKHAATCHQGTHIEGDNDFFEDDDVYRKVRELDL